MWTLLLYPKKHRSINHSYQSNERKGKASSTTSSVFREKAALCAAQFRALRRLQSVTRAAILWSVVAPVFLTGGPKI